MRFLLWPLSASMFMFLMTALGAALVFFFKREISDGMQRMCMGFAGGVMSAAAVFSLLVPAAEQGSAAAVSMGFLLGALFILLLDGVIRRMHTGAGDEPKRRRMLLFSAVTLHNIPEGMAVGVAFAGGQPGAHAAAWALALGIAVQNFPEGAAVSLPFRQGGVSRWRSFLCGAISGAVEPAAAALAVLLCAAVGPAMPLLMAFAAGAMVLVVFEEMIPDACTSRDGLSAAMIGYAVMMALDLGLG